MCEHWGLLRRSQVVRLALLLVHLRMLCPQHYWHGPRLVHGGSCEGTAPLSLSRRTQGCRLGRATPVSCSCRGTKAVIAPRICIRAEAKHRQATSTGGTSRSGIESACPLSAFMQPAKGSGISLPRADRLRSGQGLCTPHLLAAIPISAWLLIPDAASAEGLVPMDVFQSWLVRFLYHCEPQSDTIIQTLLYSANANAD